MKTTTDDLDALSDDKLNEAFAVEAAGWTLSEAPFAWGRHFSTDLNAILPYLERANWRGTSLRTGATSAATVIVLSEDKKQGILGFSNDRPNDFCRAACLALIRRARAKGKA